MRELKFHYLNSGQLKAQMPTLSLKAVMEAHLIRPRLENKLSQLLSLWHWPRTFACSAWSPRSWMASQTFLQDWEWMKGKLALGHPEWRQLTPTGTQDLLSSRGWQSFLRSTTWNLADGTSGRTLLSGGRSISSQPSCTEDKEINA